MKRLITRVKLHFKKQEPTIHALLELKKWKQAENLCHKAIRRNAKDAEMHSILGYIYQQTGRYTQAVDSCSAALSFSFEGISNYVTLGLSLCALQQYPKARVAFEKVYAVNPAYGSITYLLLETIAHTESVEKMMEAYHRMRMAGSITADMKIYTLHSVFDWAKQNTLPIVFTEKAIDIPIINPPVLGKGGYQKKDISSHKTTLSNTPYVAELHNVLIFSKSSVIIVDNVALHDSSVHPLFGDSVSLQYDKTVIMRHKDKLLMRHDNYPVVEHDGGIFLSGLVTDAFGHWVPEFLPKLQFFEHHPDFKKLPIIVDEEMPQSHFDYLSSISQNPLFRLPAKTGLRCRKLLVAPTSTFYPVELIHNHNIPQHEIGALSPASLDFLRKRVVATIRGKSLYGPKLYFSRRNMKWRCLINEPEIINFLIDEGFDIVDIETVDFADQVRMFQEAECIIAPNGSSLLNIIFSKPTVKLFVLSQPGLFNWGGFYGPMHSLGYDMVFITGDDAQPGKHADYSIPLNRLRKVLADYA